MQIPIPLCRDDTYDIVDAQFCNLPHFGKKQNRHLRSLRINLVGILGLCLQVTAYGVCLLLYTMKRGDVAQFLHAGLSRR